MYGIKISTTYETWNEDSLNAGETDDRGYEIENEEYDFRDLVRLIREGGYTEDNGDWFSTCDSEINYHSGEHTNRSIHFSDIPRKRKYFDLAFTLAIKKRK